MNQDYKVFCLVTPQSSLNDFKIQGELSFSESELSLLIKTLTLNFFENLKLTSSKEAINVMIFLKENEYENYFQEIPALYADLMNIQLVTNSDKLIDELKNYSKFFIVISDVMGISTKDIITSNNLISSDDNTLVISKSENEEICFIAFNHYDNYLIKKMIEPNLDYENFLSGIETEKFFIHIINGHFRVNNFSNFKLLYKKLSTKESLEYCNQEIHEKFTNLFIEYRDYIK